MTPEQYAEQTVNSLEFSRAIEWEDETGMLRLIAATIRTAVKAERGRGYGPGFQHTVEQVRPLAESIVERVRINTPDLTGLGMVTITANNIARVVCDAVKAERESCAKMVEEFAKSEPQYIINADKLAARIRERNTT